MSINSILCANNSTLQNFPSNQELALDITISNLQLRYQHQWLFDNFNLYLPAKKWTCLLGQSGVGKSTLLKFIAGLLDQNITPHTGTVSTSNNLSPTKNISYMAQQDLLMPWLSVMDNILIGYRLRGCKVTKAIEKKAGGLLSQVGLKQVSHLRPEKLSCGMRQRAALVRTIMEERSIVLMDEPFAALDAITKLKLQTLAAELFTEHTVVLVTHDPFEALRLGRYVYVLSGAPVKLSVAIEPAGKTPRELTDAKLLKQQAELLELLAR